MAQYIDKTYIGKVAPSNRHVLWIDISRPMPVMKSYLNGGWTQVSSAYCTEIVDTQEYPTLQDFLASEGEIGVIYLYPNEDPTTQNRYNGYIWINNTIRYELIDEITIDISGKADKVKNAVAGNIAGIDSEGNLIDSGHKHSDYATAAQGAKADTAVQQVTIGTTTTGNAGTNASVTNSGTSTNPVLNFTIPRGADGADAVNPFKGWWPDLATLKAAHTATAGDSAYVKDASPATTWSIYVYDSTSSTDNYWADSGLDADTSHAQTFESGEEVNEVGIDDEPTAGSNNLVKSGGVKDCINNLTSKIEAQDINDVGWISKKFFIMEDMGLNATSGAIGSYPSMSCTGYICVHEGQTITYYTQAWYSAALMASYNEKKQLVSIIANPSGEAATTITYNVPSNVNYICFVSRKNVNSSIIVSPETLGAQIDNSTCKSNDLSKLFFDGSTQNPSSTTGVGMGYIANPIGLSKVEIKTNRPNSENCRYYYSAITYNNASGPAYNFAKDSSIKQRELPIAATNNVIELQDGELGIAWTIYEYNTVTNNYMPLRKSDFDGYDIYMEDADNDENKVKISALGNLANISVYRTVYTSSTYVQNLLSFQSGTFKESDIRITVEKIGQTNVDLYVYYYRKETSYPVEVNFSASTGSYIDISINPSMIVVVSMRQGSTCHGELFISVEPSSKLEEKFEQYQTQLCIPRRSREVVYSKVASSAYLKEMPVETATDVEILVNVNGNDTTCDLTHPARTISGAINWCELNLIDKKIRINVIGVYRMLTTENIGGFNNTYIITASDGITSSVFLSIVDSNNDIIKCTKPSGVTNVDYLEVNDRQVPLSYNYLEDKVDLLGKFYNSANNWRIQFVSSSEGVYTYKLIVDTEDFEVGNIVKIFCEWVCYIGKVTAVEEDYILFTSNSNYGQPLMTSSYPECVWQLRNTSKLAEEGTYWYDDNYIYYKPLSGEVISSIKCATLSTLFNIHGGNICFSESSIYGSNAKDLYTVYKQGDMDRNGCINISNAYNIHFLDCEFYGITDHVIRAYNNSKNISIQRCCFHDLGCGAICISSGAMPWQVGYIRDNTCNIYIESNIIRSYGRTFDSACGIIVSYANNVSIISNYIFDGYYTGISVGWGWEEYHMNKNTAIIGNVIHHIMQFVMQDGAGIYTLSCLDGGIIDSNKIYCVNSRYRNEGSIGIYHDSGSSQILDYNNIIYGCDNGISASAENIKTGYNVLQNNIIAYIGGYAVCAMDAIGTTMMSCILHCINHSKLFRNKNIKSIVEDSVFYDFTTSNVVNFEDSFNSYGWKTVCPEFVDPINGNYSIVDTQDNHLKCQSMGFVYSHKYTFDGWDYPIFNNPNYADYLVVSESFLLNYKRLYKALSPMPNPFFD